MLPVPLNVTFKSLTVQNITQEIWSWIIKLKGLERVVFCLFVFGLGWFWCFFKCLGSWVCLMNDGIQLHKHISTKKFICTFFVKCYVIMMWKASACFSPTLHKMVHLLLNVEYSTLQFSFQKDHETAVVFSW